MITIKTIDGGVLYQLECDSLRWAVEIAAKSGANLIGANLIGANLIGANLIGVNLADANLADANLAGASLAGAYLAGAYLAGAYLAGANLAGANLADANLAGANLIGASLAGAYLIGIKGMIANSHDLLAHIALRHDASLAPVAAMIAGRLVGCWREYTTAIRQYFSEDTMRKLWEAWSQDESWGVEKEMRKHGWPKPGDDCVAEN